MSCPVSLRAALLAVLATGLSSFSAEAPAARNSEQLVFSGTGAPPASSEPFGFWIWCQVEPASENSHYDTDCNGALYLYASGRTVHVTGEVSEPEEGVYVLDLAAPRSSLMCELSNATPIVSGPQNTVMAECSLGGIAIGGLLSNNAVVVATGPG